MEHARRRAHALAGALHGLTQQRSPRRCSPAHRTDPGRSVTHTKTILSPHPITELWLLFSLALCIWNISTPSASLLGTMCDTSHYTQWAQSFCARVAPCHGAASSLKDWHIIESIRDAHNGSNKKKWGRGDYFSQFIPAVQPRGWSGSRSRRAARDHCHPVPSLGQGTNPVSATSLLCAFVKDMESHFKMMKTCQYKDLDCLMRVFSPMGDCWCFKCFYLGALLYCCLYWKWEFSYREKLNYKNNYFGGCGGTLLNESLRLARP